MTKSEILSVRYPGYNVSGIEGWLDPKEGMALYSISLLCTGPILEIGSWKGLSTAYIAYGCRDNLLEGKFITTEANTSKEHYREIGKDRIGYFDKLDDKEPSAICSMGEFVKFRNSLGTLIDETNKNMKRLNLSKYVTVLEGKFEEVAPKKKYSFIFCDAMHSKAGIDLRLPPILGLLAPKAVFACHDVPHAGLVGYLMSKLPHLSEWFVVKNLFVGILL